MRSRAFAADESESEINLTPMLDVVFIMLVFFLVTAAFVNFEAVPVYLPPSTEQLGDVESVVVNVRGNGVFVVGSRTMTKASLVPYLQALRSQNPEATFGLLVAAGAPVKDTVAAADAGRRVGFDAVPIMQVE